MDSKEEFDAHLLLPDTLSDVEKNMIEDVVKELLENLNDKFHDGVFLLSGKLNNKNER